MIKFTNVTKIYKKSNTQALDNISFSIDDGEFVFIVGSSGAGKSTIIKHILREEIPTSGDIIVNDYNLNKLHRWHIAKYRRSLGVVFQDFRLIPDMNVYDNVAFALRVTNIKNSDIKRRVPYILNLVGLSAKARFLPSQISGGEQQRVALARALVNNPSIIIADEPTGNIDPNLSYEIMDLLKEINKCGTTVLVVTHEHELVSKIKGRIINIENGRICSDTKSKDWSNYDL